MRKLYLLGISIIAFSIIFCMAAFAMDSDRDGVDDSIDPCPFDVDCDSDFYCDGNYRIDRNPSECDPYNNLMECEANNCSWDGYTSNCSAKLECYDTIPAEQCNLRSWCKTYPQCYSNPSDWEACQNKTNEVDCMANPGDLCVWWDGACELDELKHEAQYNCVWVTNVSDCNANHHCIYLERCGQKTCNYGLKTSCINDPACAWDPIWTECWPRGALECVPGDCNATDSTINPTAKELCDAKDNDCNSLIDEAAEISNLGIVTLNNSLLDNYTSASEGDTLDNTELFFTWIFNGFGTNEWDASILASGAFAKNIFPGMTGSTVDENVIDEVVYMYGGVDINTGVLGISVDEPCPVSLYDYTFEAPILLSKYGGETAQKVCARPATNTSLFYELIIDKVNYENLTYTKKLVNYIEGEVCSAVICGDGSLEYPEECDDGNSVAGDGCSAGCASEEAGQNFDDLEITDNGDETYNYAFLEDGIGVIEIDSNQGVIDLANFDYNKTEQEDMVAVSMTNLNLNGTTKSISIKLNDVICAIDDNIFRAGTLDTWDCLSDPGRIVWNASNTCNTTGSVQAIDANSNALPQYTCDKFDYAGKTYARISGFNHTTIVSLDMHEPQEPPVDIKEMMQRIELLEDHVEVLQEEVEEMKSSQRNFVELINSYLSSLPRGLRKDMVCAWMDLSDEDSADALGMECNIKKNKCKCKGDKED